MIKADLVKVAAESSGVVRQKAAQAVDTILDALRRALIRGDRIELRGFGVLLVKQKKGGTGRNPKRPSEVVPIPPGFAIRFKPGKELRDMVSSPSEPVARDSSP